jgi:hypothetical protein
MYNVFILATIISITYFIAKFIEMRFIEKENKPLKVLIKDTIVVYICVVSGSYVLEQLSPMMQNVGESISTNPAVFTGNPEF